MSKVRVFSTQTCPYCVILKNHLKQHNIDFEDIDVGKDYNAAMEMIRISGQRGVPVSEINGNVIVGFDQPRINKLLGIS